MIEKLKEFWIKYGIIYALIVTIVMIFALFKQPEVKEIKTLDTKIVKSFYDKISQIKTELTNTKIELKKEIAKQQDVLKNISTKEDIIKTYDAITGKLIKEEIKKTADDKTVIKTDIATKTNTTSVSTTIITDKRDETKKEDDTTITKEKDIKTIKGHKLFGGYIYTTLLPFEGFVAQDIELGLKLNLIENISIDTGVSYNLLSDKTFINRLGLSLGISIYELF